MKQKAKIKKLSRNLNVVETFNDFSLDTQIMDFDYEDLVDYVEENADVFYWLNIESIWGRCGFIWDSYENRGHFNNVTIKFTTLPKIPDPHRIKTFSGLFSSLSAGTYYINDNDWENITELGGWGNSSQTFIFDMPSAPLTKIYGSSTTSKYQPMSSIDSIDWSTLTSPFSLIINDDNRDIVQLDMSKLFKSKSLRYLQLFLDTKDTQEEAVIINNVPEVISKEDEANHIYIDGIDTLGRTTLYKQYIDDEGNIALRTLFHRKANKYYWPYEDEENPPIMQKAFFSKSSSYYNDLFQPYSVSEENFINCKVVPGYKNNVTWEDKIEIPEEYDVFNNPDHKVVYMYNTYSSNSGFVYTKKTGVAFYQNKVKFTNRLKLRVNTELFEKLDYKPTFTYSGSESPIVISTDRIAVDEAVKWFDDINYTSCAFRQDTHSVTKYEVVYHTIVLHNSGIEYYDNSGTVELTSTSSHLYYRGHSISGMTTNEIIYIINIADGCKLHMKSSYGYVLMLQDIYFNTGSLAIPHDTPHKVIFDSDAYSLSVYILDCVQGQTTIPNVFDFSNVQIKEGYEIQDKVSFSTFKYFLYKEALRVPEFITVDPTLDLIWQGDLKIVHNTERSCKELMEKLQTGFIFDYPLSRVKQISTPSGTGNKIHLEGGFVFSLNDEDTVGNAEGVEYFLSKFKFKENPQPKENQLYLNSEQYALFTPEQVASLVDNGWEVIEVLF